MIGDIFRVLRAGVELTNAETWKRRQVAVNALSATLAALVALASSFGYPLPLDKDGIDAIAAGVVAVVGLFNGWATVATTSRIGLPPRGNPGAPGDPARPDPGRQTDHPFSGPVG